MTASPDPDFADFIKRAKAVSVQGFLQARGLWQVRMSGDRGVPCPACGGKDRFAVNVRKNVFTCRKSGAGGGALALWAHLAGMDRVRGRDFIEACSELLNEDPPKPIEETAVEKMQRIERRREMAEAQARDTLKAEAEAAANARFYRERERSRAYELWSESIPGALCDTRPVT